MFKPTDNDHDAFVVEEKRDGEYHFDENDVVAMKIVLSINTEWRSPMSRTHLTCITNGAFPCLSFLSSRSKFTSLTTSLIRSLRASGVVSLEGLR